MGAFDNNDRIIGDYIGGIVIQKEDELESFCRENQVKVAFLCIPSNSAPSVVKKLYNVGVKNFWNFTHYYIQKDFPDAVVESVHLGDMMMTLCYRINETEE